jgi:hypothetical protein
MSYIYCEHETATYPFCPICGEALSGSPATLVTYLGNLAQEAREEVRVREDTVERTKAEFESSLQIQQLANAMRRLEYSKRDLAKWENWTAWVSGQLTNGAAAKRERSK